MKEKRLECLMVLQIHRSDSDTLRIDEVIDRFASTAAWRLTPAWSIFRVLGYPSTILCTAYMKQFYPKPMVPMESRYSAFGRYRPLKGAEKWSRDHHKN